MLWGEEPADPATGRYREVRYDLMRIAFDQDDATWGELETVLSVDRTRLSVTQPRISPDGRFLAFCMSDYSTFPSFQPDADLYLMDLATGRYAPMACSTDQAESWHSWSSNSRWLVFSTKAGDGRFIKPYFSYVDEGGVAHKPFVLPQRDPTFYDSFIKLYQMPELVREPVPLGAGELARAIRTQPWAHVGAPVTGATPRPDSEMGPAPGGRPDPWSTPTE